jgi:lipopolysaccharide transport system ATP-binding protein
VSDVAIRVEGLGKQYRIGKRERYKTLRDMVTDTVSSPFRRAYSVVRPSSRETRTASDLIWALRNVSFEVPQGSVVGVIGRNGAGKSTLLKVLSRITEPTEGRAEIHGRVGSLLEVGTGFHPELTGRENVFLNGAILGMRRAEIMRKFDEIVAFAEIDKFVDTPVKHYSSGMYMRLAFAVAAHLEPETLVVDEVLAVGDVKFQKKCLGKMGEVARQGRTVLFVSHSMASIASLCSTGILLHDGSVTRIGAISDVIDGYMQAIAGGAKVVDLRCRRGNRGSGDAHITEAAILDDAGRCCTRFQYGDNICVAFTVEQCQGSPAQMCVVVVKTNTGIPVLHLTAHDSVAAPLRVDGTATVRCTIPNCQLYPGSYTVSIWIGSTPYLSTDWHTDVLKFDVDQGQLPGYGVELGFRHGLIHAQSRWTVSRSVEHLVELVLQ